MTIHTFSGEYSKLPCCNTWRANNFFLPLQRDLYKALVNDGFLRKHGYALAATDVS
jgi:hypothetical protein